MKNYNIARITLFFPIAIGLSACNQTPKEVEVVETTVVEKADSSKLHLITLEEGVELATVVPISEGMKLGFSRKNTTIKWTAFKTTEKIPVSGTFNEFSISEPKAGRVISEAFIGSKITIPVNSINTEKPERDEKIIRTFFGSMVKTSDIVGEIVEIKDNELAIKFTFNKTSKIVKAGSTFEKGEFKIKGILDLNNWKAQNAINALNDECKDLHKGADGVTKLWSEIEFEIITKLTQK